jgi:hypothetical protein
MNKISRFWNILNLVSIITLNACTNLNGTYCTRLDLMNQCISFDKKARMLEYTFVNCLGGEVKKGKYKRKGNLLIVDLIPYKNEEKLGSVIIDYLGKTMKDSINLNIVIQDSIFKEGLIGDIHLTDNHSNSLKKSTDFEGNLSFRVGVDNLPITIETEILGSFNRKVKIEQAKDANIKILLVGQGFMKYSQKVERQLFIIENIRKNHFYCKPIYEWDERKMTKEDKVGPFSFYRIEKENAGN